MKCECSSSSSHDVADNLKTTEMLATNGEKKAMFLDGMDAFDDFLQLVATIEAPKIDPEKLRIAMPTEGVVDDDTSFFSDDSDDELPQTRVRPGRGVRRDHSGDLERLFQPKLTTKDETIRENPSLQDKNLVMQSTTSDGSRRSKSLSRKPTTRTRRSDINAASEHGRRVCTVDVDQRTAPFDPSDDDNKAARILSRHSALDLSKSDVPSARRRVVRRLTPPNVTIRQELKDVLALTDHSCSVSQEMSRTESRVELRRSRGDLSSSEHSRQRLRRDTLYATKRQTHFGTSDLERIRNRPNSEIDFQRAAAVAAKKRQNAGRRISSGETASPPRDDHSKEESFRRSAGSRNSSAELLGLSPARLPRSHTLGTNLCRSAGPKRSVNNLNLAGVYSNGGSSIAPVRTVDDLRRSLKNSGGRRNDIDDLVMKMTSGAKSSGLPTKLGNATWN